MSSESLIQRAYQTMLETYGPQHWWPGDTPWEICTGAILTQNTSWSNVEKAISRLKAAAVMTPQLTLELPLPELEYLLQPSGCFRVKAVRLQAAARWWLDQIDDTNQPRWRGRDLNGFRRDLLQVNGIGPETADSIMLYSFSLPTFVIDAYTRRIAVRHLKIPHAAAMDYHELQHIFTCALPADAALFNEYHALLVQTAKSHCRKVECTSDCPLKII